MFRKRIEEIHFQDVQAFCESAAAAEATLVEYKSDWPSRLEKSLSSFANTHGGILFLGIRTDAKNKPIWPPPGIEGFAGISERITSISWKSIDPPIIPEIALVPIPDSSGQTIVVIRVHESLETPHAIDGGTGVYYRVNSQNEPIQRADLHRIHWLESRRLKAVQLRSNLIKRSRARFDREFSMPHRRAIEFHITPSYPYGPLTERVKLGKLTQIGLLFPDSFRLDTAYESTPVGSGIGFWNQKDRDGNYIGWAEHWELNVYGGLHHISEWRNGPIQEMSGNIFNLNEWKRYLDRFLGVASTWYSSLGFLGSVSLRLAVTGLFGHRVISYHQDTFARPPRHLGVCKETDLMNEESWVWTGHKDDAVESLTSLVKNTLWDMGCKDLESNTPYSVREYTEGVVSVFASGD